MGKENPSGGRQRTIPLYVRVTEEEEKIIREKMTLTGTSNFSVYARKMLMDGYIIKYDFQVIKNLSNHLGYLARNIHQISKRANETGSIYKQDVADLKEMYYEIYNIAKTEIIKMLRRI